MAALRRAAPPSMSVIVVSHDSGGTLHRCVQGVLAQQPASGSAGLEVIVVDNASRDGAPGALPADPRVRLLLNPDNRGFARACNQGAELARGDRLLFLNPDCFLPEGALAVLSGLLAEHPGTGVLGAALEGADGQVQGAAHRNDISPLSAIARALRLEGRFGLPRVEMQPSVTGEAMEVQAVSGAAMLLPRAAFDAVGGFDAGYVLHFEDLDLCRRIREAGYTVRVAPAVRALHLKGTSSSGRPVWVAWQKHRGMLRYDRRFGSASRSRRALMALLVWGHFVVVALPWALLGRLRRATRG